MTATRPCITSRADRGRRPARRRRSQRRRQIDAVQGHRGLVQAARRAASSARASSPPTSPICRRPPRSTAPSRSTSSTWSRWGSGAAPACSAASAAAERASHRDRDPGGRPLRLRGAADRLAVGRPDAAHAVRPAAAAGRPRDPARRTVHRDRRQDRRRLLDSGAPLARRAAHRHRRAARSRTRAQRLSATLLLAREPVAWGPTARCADARESAARAAHVRGVRRRAPRPARTRPRDA